MEHSEAFKKLMQAHSRPKTRKPKKRIMSLVEEQRVERIYNAIHKGRYHGYGEIVQIVETTPTNVCVCCGGLLSEDKTWVCSSCEAKGGSHGKA